MPIYVWALLAVLLWLWWRHRTTDTFFVQTVPQAPVPYATSPITVSESKLEDELASVIDTAAPDPTTATALAADVVYTTGTRNAVEQVLQRLNASTDYELALITLTSASQFQDSAGTKYLTVKCTAHDMKRIFIREILMSLSIPATGQVLVRSIAFTNCAKDDGSLPGAGDLDQIQTFANFPAPWSDEW